MTAAPIYKRVSVETTPTWGFGAFILKNYLSFKDGYGVSLLIQLYHYQFILVIWRLGKRSRDGYKNK